MSIERGDKLLIEEMALAIGATATPSEVVAYLMEKGALPSNYIRGMIARERFRRVWMRRVGNMDVMKVCEEIATALDIRPKTVHKHALKVMVG
jgi:DNA-binding CsgD family transcriptional regulator